MNGMPKRARELFQPAGHLFDQPLAFDDAGTRDEEERPVDTDLESCELHVLLTPRPLAAAPPHDAPELRE